MNLDDIMHKFFTLSDDYMLHRGNDGEKDFFLFNVSTGKIFKLNETSFTILESFSENVSFSAVVDNLTKKFSVEKGILIEDLSGLMEKWTESEVLVENE
jgi:hypothetical protein